MRATRKERTQRAPSGHLVVSPRLSFSAVVSRRDLPAAAPPAREQTFSEITSAPAPAPPTREQTFSEIASAPAPAPAPPTRERTFSEIASAPAPTPAPPTREQTFSEITSTDGPDELQSPRECLCTSLPAESSSGGDETLAPPLPGPIPDSLSPSPLVYPHPQLQSQSQQPIIQEREVTMVLVDVENAEPNTLSEVALCVITCRLAMTLTGDLLVHMRPPERHFAYHRLVQVPPGRTQEPIYNRLEADYVYRHITGLHEGLLAGCNSTYLSVLKDLEWFREAHGGALWLAREPALERKMLRRADIGEVCDYFSRDAAAAFRDKGIRRRAVEYQQCGWHHPVLPQPGKHPVSEAPAVPHCALADVHEMEWWLVRYPNVELLWEVGRPLPPPQQYLPSPPFLPSLLEASGTLV